jgi:hypothetical protein
MGVEVALAVYLVPAALGEWATAIGMAAQAWLYGQLVVGAALVIRERTQQERQ